jgi:nucleotide-binding universal stress UspA family protein
MNATENYVIVVGIDFEADGNLALDAALSMAVQRPGAEVHPVFVDGSLAAKGVELGPNAESIAKRSEDTFARLAALADERLAAVVGDREASLPPLLAHYRVGKPAEEIVQLAVDVGADMIVVGTHGRRGVSRLMMGSVAAQVTKLARCPVFVVRPKDHEHLGEIPEIEPPCPDCLAARAAQQGFWCERHANMRRVRPVRTQRYHYNDNQASGTTPRWGAMFD